MSEPKKFKEIGSIRFYEPDLWMIPSSILSIIDSIITLITIGMIMPDLNWKFLVWNLTRKTKKQEAKDN